LLLCQLSALALAEQNIPPGYEIVQLTDTSYPELFVSMNNVGQVVWAGKLGPTNDTMEIFLYDGATGATSRITDDNVHDFLPEVNDQGVIVWSRRIGPIAPSGLPSSELMVRLPDGTLLRLTDNDVDDLEAALNELGQIAWSQRTYRGCRDEGAHLMFFDGERILQLTDNDWRNETPALNDLGAMAWPELDVCDPDPFHWKSLIKLYTGGSVQTLSEPGLQSQATGINNAGTCSWQFNDPVTFERGLMLWNDGHLTRLTDDGSTAVLNNRGDVYFIRQDPVNGWQAWVYLNGQFYQLSDDPFPNLSGAINDRGECAWKAGAFPNGNVRLMRRLPSGDLNCDGVVDAFDIEPFVSALVAPAAYSARWPDCDRMLADMNDDGVVNAFDIEPFARLLTP
jgi:hypothetical protein